MPPRTASRLKAQQPSPFSPFFPRQGSPLRRRRQAFLPRTPLEPLLFAAARLKALRAFGFPEKAAAFPPFERLLCSKRPFRERAAFFPRFAPAARSAPLLRQARLRPGARGTPRSVFLRVCLSEIAFERLSFYKRGKRFRRRVFAKNSGYKSLQFLLFR